MRKSSMMGMLISMLVMYYCVQRAALESLETYTRAHFNKENKPIILWDIHDVILQKDRSAQLEALWCFNRKRELLNGISLGMSKEMIHSLLTLLKSEVTGEVFMAIARRHGNNALADLILTIANTQQINCEIAAIIQELHEQGYHQHIGSNIGIHTFDDLLTKPYVQSVFNDRIFDLGASQLVNYDLDNVDDAIKKPQLRFYINYLSKNRIDPQNVVFIDDKNKNVYAAQQCDMYGILFKNAAQLRDDLWSLLGISSRG